MMKSLNPRERYIVAGGIAILVVLLIVFGVAVPYDTALERLDKAINIRRAQLVEVKQMQVDYQRLKQQETRLQRDLDRQEEISPLTFLERTASEVGGRESLVLMRPLPAVTHGQLRTELTEFKLEKLNLEQVLRILQKIEQARPSMLVDKLHLKQRFDNDSQLDMSATVSATRRI